jgi:hypothetical protein
VRRQLCFVGKRAVTLHSLGRQTVLTYTPKVGVILGSRRERKLPGQEAFFWLLANRRAFEAESHRQIPLAIYAREA